MSLPIFQLAVPAPKNDQIEGLVVRHSDKEVLSIHYLPKLEGNASPKNKMGEKIADCFRNYFDNPTPASFAALRALPCRLADLSPSKQKVSAAIREIPYGEVRAYGYIARKTNSAMQYPGTVCRENPFAVVIPCFRVIKANGALGGFKGNIHVPEYETSLKVKAWLLEREGCQVIRNGGDISKWKVRPAR